MRTWKRRLASVVLMLAGMPALADDIVSGLDLRVAPAPVREDPRWAPTGPIVVRLFGPEIPDQLRQAAGDVQLIGVRDESEAVAAMQNATALLGFCSPELLAAAPKLAWIQLYTAGSENCVTRARVRDGEILLTNMQRVSSPQIAEHVIGLLLAFTRGIGAQIAAQADQQWNQDLTPRADRWELGGRTMLVVGLGGIGTQTAQRANALGMRVIAIRASGRPGPDYVAEVGKPDQLIAMAGRADVVVNSLPLTPDTEGLFDADVFTAMPDHAYFINVGRGQTVVTDDLVAALKSGEIAGAGLDVTDPEPLPPGHPLWTAPNVIITPHIAAGSDKIVGRLFAVVEENLRRYLAGEPMLSVVEPDRGY